MENLTQELKKVLQGRRNFKKRTFLLLGSIYRGTNNDKFTFEQVERKLLHIGGIN